MAAKIDSARLVFEEALAAFAQRNRLVGTHRYDDLRSEEHYRAFAVAGAMKADLLADLHKAVGRAIEDGVGIEDFRKDFFGIVQKHGWHGWTGEGTKAGEAWRTRVIYTTNIRKSYATGRHAQMTDPEFLAIRPYWRWVHSGLSREPRPEHLAWDGMTLHHSDPFWRSHYPPRIPPDYGCRCRAVAVRKPAEGAQTVAPRGWEKNKDEGAGAPPSLVAEEIRYFVEAKARKLPPLLGKELRTAAVAHHQALLDKVGIKPAAVTEFARFVADKKGDNLVMSLGTVKNVEQIKRVTGVDLAGYQLLVDKSAVQHVTGRHGDLVTEKNRGQLPITAADFAVIQDAVRRFDHASSGTKTATGREAVLFDKLVGNVGYRFVLEVRPGKKQLALTSVIKKKGTWI